MRRQIAIAAAMITFFVACTRDSVQPVDELTAEKVAELLEADIGAKLCLYHSKFESFPVQLDDRDARGNAGIFRVLEKEGLLKQETENRFSLTPDGERFYLKDRDSGFFCYSDGYDVKDVSYYPIDTPSGRQSFEIRFSVIARDPAEWINNPEIHSQVSMMSKDAVKALSEPVAYRCTMFRKDATENDWSFFYNNKPGGMTVHRRF
jgi:hypothetical protein